MPEPESSSPGHRGRMDFTIETLSADEAASTVQFALVPDSRRYEIVERDGKEFYRDKFLHHLISAEEMNSAMMNQLPGVPLYSLNPSIESAPEYAKTRQSAIASDIRTGHYSPPSETAVPHRRVEDDRRTRDIAFLSVDICGSTAQRLANPEGFDRAFRIFVSELGTIVGQFNSVLLKLTGDGFIAAIDHPCFTRQCDNTVDMGLSFLVMLRDSINPALKEVGLEPFSIRVGADYGPTSIKELGVPPTGFSQLDVASDALNRAVKIEQSCKENEFRIGRSLYELIHVQWLERAKEVPLEDIEVGLAGYPIYQVT